MQVAEEVLKEYIDDKMIKNRRIETIEDYSRSNKIGFTPNSNWVV